MTHIFFLLVSERIYMYSDYLLSQVLFWLGHLVVVSQPAFSLWLRRSASTPEVWVDSRSLSLRLLELSKQMLITDFWR